MKPSFFAAIATILGSLAVPAAFAGPTVGAAPKGDAGAVASRVIKYNFPECKRVSGATRAADGSIRARCDGIEYLVFTVFNPKEGKVIDVALNCSAARSLLKVDC